MSIVEIKREIEREREKERERERERDQNTIIKDRKKSVTKKCDIEKKV